MYDFCKGPSGYFGDSETDERCGVEVTCKNWEQNLLSWADCAVIDHLHSVRFCGIICCH